MSLSGLAGCSGRPRFNLSAASARNSRHLWRWHILPSLPPPPPPLPDSTPPSPLREFSLGFAHHPNPTPRFITCIKERPAVGPPRPASRASSLSAAFNSCFPRSRLPSPMVSGHSAANFPLFCSISGCRGSELGSVSRTFSAAHQRGSVRWLYINVGRTHRFKKHQVKAKSTEKKKQLYCPASRDRQSWLQKG